MLDYILKFSKLAPEIKNLVSNPATQAILANLEAQYKVSLAALVMRVMIKEVIFTDLNNILVSEFGLEKIKADELEFALKNKVFNEAIGFLMLGMEKPQEILVKAEPQNIPIEHFGWTEADNRDIKAQQTKIIDQADYDQEIEDKLNKLISDLKINFSSEGSQARFRNILKTFLRGVRDKVHTKEALMRDLQSGGLGLDEKTVEIIFTTIKTGQVNVDALKNIKNNLSQASSSREFSGQRDVAYDLAALVAKKEQEKIAAPAETLDLPVKEDELLIVGAIHESLLLEAPEEELLLEAPREFEKFLEKEVVRREIEPKETEMQPDTEVNFNVPPITAPVTTLIPAPEIIKELSKNIVVPDKLAEISKQTDVEALHESLLHEVPVEKLPVQNIDTPIILPINNLQKNDHGKFTMNDVKKIDRLSDPVEEIQNLTIKQFRRLADKPSEACARIKTRITSLEKENFKHRLIAIKAWKTSPVNQEYLNLCRLSLKQGKMLVETVKAQLKNNPNSLTQIELEAIIKLNHDLSY